MKKRLLFYILVTTLMVSCARNSNVATKTTIESIPSQILWQSYAGNVNSNYVVTNGELPTSYQLKTALDVPGDIISAPVIFKGEDDLYHVIILSLNGNNYNLDKYVVRNNQLEQDSDYTVDQLMYADADLRKHHQIVLAEENGNITLFVAHRNGVLKYDAIAGGLPIASYSSDDSVFRLLVDGAYLYAQSKSSLIKLTLNLEEKGKVDTINFGDPGRSLPLVISNSRDSSFLYAVGDPYIYKVDLKNFTLFNSLSFENAHKSHYPSDVADKFTPINVGAISAANDGDVIYSTIAVENFSDRKTVTYPGKNSEEIDLTYVDDPHALGDYDFFFKHSFSTTRFHSFSGTNTLVTQVHKFYNDCHQLDGILEKNNIARYESHHQGIFETRQRIHTSYGDSAFSAISVLSNELVIPGVTTTFFSNHDHGTCKDESIRTAGLIRIHKDGVKGYSTDYDNIGTTGYGDKNGYLVGQTLDKTRELPFIFTPSYQNDHGGNTHHYLLPEDLYFRHLVKGLTSLDVDDQTELNNFNFNPQTGFYDVVWNYVPRFVFVQGAQYFSVMNVSANLHGLKDSAEGSFGKSWKQYLESPMGNNILDKISNYNSRLVSNSGEIVTFPKDVEVTSVAVGDKFVVVVGNNGVESKLYLIN